MAQVGGVAVLSADEYRDKLALFAGIDNVRFKRQVKPGDTLRLEVELHQIRRCGAGTARRSTASLPAEATSCLHSSTSRSHSAPPDSRHDWGPVRGVDFARQVGAAGARRSTHVIIWSPHRMDPDHRRLHWAPLSGPGS